ncbi:oxamate carbamoyltransferase subunit AllH family protein [Tessaracoccus sp. G1721]
MTRTGIAITVDREVFPSATGAVSIHSVFATAANLSTSAGLVTVVAGSRPAGPRTVVVDLPTLDGLALRPGNQGELTPARLRLGDHEFDLTRAATWQPVPLDGPILPAAVDELAARLDGVRLGDGPAGRSAGPTPFEEAVAAELDARTREFDDAVARHHLADARGAAARLLGLGQGLTPSGDDWLAGFVLAAHHAPETLGTATAAVDGAARPGATVDVSLSILRNALQGHAIDPLHRLLAALTRPPGPGIDEALAALADVGHSSGTDMALGLLSAAHLTTHPQGAQ